MQTGTSQGYQGFREQRPILRAVRRALVFLLLLFAAYQVATLLFVRTVEQQSISMRPTIDTGDRLILVPMIYGSRLPLFGARLPGFRAPERGDLIAVRPAYMQDYGFGSRLADPVSRFATGQERSIVGRADWRSRLQVKRLIGLPGDTIRIERFVAFVKPAGQEEFVNEFALSGRAYSVRDAARPGAWQDTDFFGGAHGEVELGEDEYFVLSDDRTIGLDSRHWGVVQKDDIHGKLWLRIWPITRFGTP
ncbi:MAG: signal peptidase I [Spirochaetales bacterium]